MPKDSSIFSIKTENNPSQSIKTEEVRKIENVEVKNEQVKVKQENIDVGVKTDHVPEQKDVKTENEDEQNIKVDVTNSHGYVYFKNIE